MPPTRNLLVFLLFAVCAHPLSAQVLPPDSSGTGSGAPGDSTGDGGHNIRLEARLGEITVTASRLRIDVAAAPQRITILDRATIERTGARHIGELLAARAGLFIRQYGEGLSTVSLRGGSPSQTLVLLDGMRLADPQLGQLDLSLFPTYVLSAVEVMHGPGSALYGSDGIGGLVNLRPRRALDNEVRISSEVGAFGERRLGAGASYRGGAGGTLVAVEYAEAEGDFLYMNESLFPAREVRRRNADRRTRSLYGASFLNTGAHHVEGAVLFADAVRGLPGLATVNPSGERQWDEHLRVWMSDDVALRSGRLSVRGFVHRSLLRYKNPNLEIDDTGRTWSGAVEAERVVPVSSDWIINGGLSAGFAQADHPMLSEAASEMHGAAFTEAVGQIGTVALYPALRADAYGIGTEDRRLAMSPRLGANVPVFDRRVHLKTGLGRAFRSPTFNERYWQPGGNPDLDPERAWSYEAGIHLHSEAPTSGHAATATPRRTPAIAGELTLLHARTLDQIVWSPKARGVWIPENVGETVTRGIEASGSVVAMAGSMVIEGGATYSFTHSVDRSDAATRTFGRQLRYVPRHLLKGFAGVSRGAFRIDANARWIGRRFVTADESQWLDPSLVVDLQAGMHRKLGSFRAELAVVLQNALDADYAVIQNYPMPPRHARVRLLIQSRSDSQ